MAGWAGFSDAELQKLQQKDQATLIDSGRGRKPSTPSRSRQQLNRERERALRIAAQQGAGTSPTSPSVMLSEQRPSSPSVLLGGQRPSSPSVLPAEQRLAKPVPTAVPPTRATATATVPPDVKLKPSEKLPVKAEEAEAVVKELETQEVEIREKTRIQQLQDEQKTMEEKNKRKKALLTKTIAEKSKQTQQEAVKLKRIQKELQTLDDMVSNDIGILRCRIEQASWDYNAARKRYEKAEAEYVASKMDLHRKTDTKEQLTEHLCAIIQQNELRKAERLEELMLQLQTSEEELDATRRLVEQEEQQDTARRLVEQEEQQDTARRLVEQEEQQDTARRLVEQQEQQDTARRLVEQQEQGTKKAVSKSDEEKLEAEQKGEEAELCLDPDPGSAVVETVVLGSAGTPPRTPPPVPCDPAGPPRDGVVLGPPPQSGAAGAGPS
ncbi:RAB6-interacting golgin [Gadus macrocephalus]|uniref:RAB6-interacting golgin n=1 Tax=Gadus macrocephalus TaxID=80720 RepID=UPI0028CB44D7|nr:RAB6-interacting golgin [Gadus macrocephalus]